MNHSEKRKRTGAAVGLALILGAFATAGHAGEITGNGKSLKNDDGSLNGRSACAFSGQNDTYSGDPTVPDEDGFTRTQNWGQLSKAAKEFLTAIGFNPGNACNPNRSGGEPNTQHKSQIGRTSQPFKEESIAQSCISVGTVKRIERVGSDWTPFAKGIDASQRASRYLLF